MGSLLVVEAHQPPGLGTVVVGALTVLFFQNKKDPCSQGPLNLKFSACLSTDSENYPLPPNTLLWDATLAHELVHIWIGQTALSNAGVSALPNRDVERWCNQVAAEFLVPMLAFKQELVHNVELQDELNRLAKRFKVSTLVILRRMHDAGALDASRYWALFQKELEKLKKVAKGSGGDFYLTLGARVGKRFAQALVLSTLEGRSSFTDALRLLSFRKMSTFDELGRSLGVVL